MRSRRRRGQRKEGRPPPGGHLHEGSPSHYDLTLVLTALFVVCLVGQLFTGWSSYNQTQNAYHAPPLTLGEYARTPTFLNGIFSNLQAALFQLAVLILFTTFLYQEGAAHSRPPGKTARKESPGQERADQARRGRFGQLLYENSLFLAFFLGFLVSLGLHLFYGTQQYDLELIREGQAPVTVLQYFVSADFWFNTFDVWQAEFLAIALLTILTVYLRQAGSAESKPVSASDRKTGVGED